MKLKAVFLKISLMIILLCQQAAMAAVVENATSSLKNRLAPIQGLTADFQQKMTNEEGKVLQQYKGQMWLKKPGQFRWEVQGAEQRIVVSNGKKVWDYDKDLEQVTVQQISKKDIKAPIFFLTGDVNSLEKDFKIQKLNPQDKNCMKESDHCFTLSPKTEHFAFQQIQIGFKGQVLRELTMVDQLNQHSYFLFTNAKLNPAIEGTLFNFIPPKGVDLVGN